MMPQISRRDDLLTGAIWFGFGLAAAWLSTELEMGSMDAPGPGFVPFWSAVFLMGCAVIMMALALLRKGSSGELEWRDLFSPRIALFLAAIGLYVATLPYLGFLVASSLLLALLFGLAQAMPWYLRVAAALTSVVVVWLVFVRLLGLNLPTGRLFGS